jgi:hypothetical protein
MDLAATTTYATKAAAIPVVAAPSTGARVKGQPAQTASSDCKRGSIAAKGGKPKGKPRDAKKTACEPKGKKAANGGKARNNAKKFLKPTPPKAPASTKKVPHPACAGRKLTSGFVLVGSPRSIGEMPKGREVLKLQGNQAPKLVKEASQPRPHGRTTASGTKKPKVGKAVDNKPRVVALTTADEVKSKTVDLKGTEADEAGKQDLDVLPEKTAIKPGKKAGRVFARPWVLSDKLVAQAQRTFPSYIVQSNGTQRHDHPYSALERAITEDIAIRELHKLGCTTITDIGGNPQRHSTSQRSGIHSCCPVLSPGDVVRNARYCDRLDFCEELSENCSVPCDGYLAVHSVYYLNPRTVLDLLHRSFKKVFVATAHKFTTGYGQMHFNGEYYESEFAMVERDVVEMTVKGNDHGAYRHDPSFWLETNYYVNGDKAMAWGYRQHGDTFIYTFRPAPINLNHGVISRELTLFESARLNTHYGDVDTGTEAYRPTVELLNITHSVVRSYGPLFWTTRKSQDIFVPKTIVNRLATFMVGKPRNKDTLQMCIREAKKMLSDKYMTIAEGLRTLLCVHCPALAFVIHLDDEIAAFNSLLEPEVADKTALHAASLLQQARSLTWVERLKKAVAPASTLVASYGNRPSRTHGITVGQSTITTSVVAEDVQHTYNTEHKLLTVVKAKANNGFKFLATPAIAAMKRMRSGSFVVDLGDEEVVKEAKTAIFQTSTVFADHAPICARGTKQDDIIALRNRVVMEVPPSDSDYWSEIENRFYQTNAVDVDAICNSIDYDLGTSFAKWNKVFTQGKKALQARAYADLLVKPICDGDLIRKTFCKKEKAVKLHSDDGELSEFVPRAIQGATDRANVALGPFIAQVSKALAGQWDGTSKFFYTSGATSISVGSWFAKHYSPGDYVVDIDFTSYDGTQNRDTFEFTKKFYLNCGIADYGQALMVLDGHKDIRGFTRNGIEYRVNDGMCSGNPDTSCSNSLVTAVSAEYGYYTHFGSTDGIHIAAMGDDNTAIIPAHLMRGTTADVLKAHLVSHFLRLGFIAKVNVTDLVSHAEFCSGLFWPARVAGVETYVLGAKPGKQLTKVGYSLTNHPPAIIAGMMDGLKTVYSHVPLLSDYAEIIRGKLPVEAASYVDPEQRYKIHAHSTTVEMSVHTPSFFEERYGLCLDAVSSSLRELLQGADLHEMVHWTYLDVIVHRDC